MYVHTERTFDITAPHIKHEGPRRSQSKNNIDPLFQLANKYRKYRAELSAPIFLAAQREPILVRGLSFSIHALERTSVRCTRGIRFAPSWLFA